MSEPAGAAPTWHLDTFEPLDTAACTRIGEFLSSQSSRIEAEQRAAIIRWKLFDNEVRPGFASAMVTDLGRIVSTCTVTPKRLWCDGAVQPWAEIGDTFTDEQFQRKGMFSALVNASRSRAQAAGFDVVYGEPNTQSAPGYLTKLEFAIKDNAALINCSLPLSTASVVPRLGDRVPAALAARLVAPRVAALSRAVSRRLMWRPRDRAVEIGEVRAASPEFDRLWERARADLPLAQVRDARYVDWRYVRHPLPFRIHTARIGGELRGYLVTIVTDEAGPPAERRLSMLDWLFTARDAGVIGRALLDAAVAEAISAQADVVGAQSSRSTPLPLPWRRYGFILRPLAKPLIVHTSAGGRRFCERTDPWHYTLSDTDGY